MILQALYEYYKRKEADPESGIAPEGFEYVEIPFFIIVGKNGDFVDFKDTRILQEKKLKGKKFLVPKLAVTKTSAVVANLFWDNAKYCLGIIEGKKVEKIEKDWEKHKKNNSEIEKQKDLYVIKPIKELEKKAQKCFLAFIENIEKKTFANHPSVQILLKFLKNNPKDKILKKINENNEIWNEIKNKNSNISFWIEGDEEPIFSLLHKQIKEYNVPKPEMMNEGICLITGEKTFIEETHPLIKNIGGTQSSGAIVSFNNDSFRSFRKKQNLNAPVSKFASFAYTTALNMMLAKDSQNNMRIGNTIIVFWSEKKTEFENVFGLFWGCPKDNPDADILAVKQLYKSVNTGSEIPDSKTKFYVLGLSPNSARLSVRFWHSGLIENFSQKIKQHFDDIEIIRRKDDNGHYSLFWMLKDLALKHEIENVPPNLNGEIVNAILTGLRYPVTLLQQCIQRIRAEQEVGRIRAGLLKAYLNRKMRYDKKEEKDKTKEKEITVSLDSTNENIGYRLGRLFATFEKLQMDAHPGINATIKDRFYGAASYTPSTVFPQLFNLKNHHLSSPNLNEGQKIFYEKLIGEITSGIPAKGVPAHLSLENQGRFAIGYYHQRQEFYKTKEK